MGKFDFAIYVFWAIALPCIGIYKFITSDANGKMAIISGVLTIAFIVVIALIKSKLIKAEHRKYFKDEDKSMVWLLSIARDVSLICLIVFIFLITTKFAGKQTLDSLLKFDIFGSSIYTEFLSFINQYIKVSSLLDFHRTLTWVAGILPTSGFFFYMLTVVTLILTLFGFGFVTIDITKGNKSKLTYYFGFGVIGLMIDHILVFIVLLSIGYAIVLFFVLAIIFGNMGSKEQPPTIESFIGDDDSSKSSYFPDFLYSSTDNTKTLYYVSSSYSDRATYHDDNGNYVEIIERDGNYYDSSTRERYY